MLQACLNGDRSKADNPQVPISHEELAVDAAKVKDAGADVLHVHPRNENSMESLTPEDVGRSSGHKAEHAWNAGWYREPGPGLSHTWLQDWSRSKRGKSSLITPR